jgi:hypothetical protein
VLDAQVTGVTGATATNLLTKAGHTFRDGQQLEYVSGTGATGLEAGASVFVRDSNPTDGTFKLTATNDDGDLGACARTRLRSHSRRVPADLGHRGHSARRRSQQRGQAAQAPQPQDRQLFNARTIETSSEEKYNIGMDDVKRLPNLRRQDERPPQGHLPALASRCRRRHEKCALVSQVFDCTVMRDGKVTHGNSEFSKSTIKIESNEQDLLDWDVDADITPAT